jgi:hypothetical protein
MDPAPALGAAVTPHDAAVAGRSRACRGASVHSCIGAFVHSCLGLSTLSLCLLAAPSAASADEHYALVITGAAGGDTYAQKYDTWRIAFVSTLREKLGYDDAHLVVLADHESAGVARATRENVQRALADLRQRVTSGDVLLILLIGHGTSLDGEEAKFNLVGPDLSASEWADLIKPIPGRLAFVDTTGGSFPFMRKLAAHGRVVLTATDSAAQQFETVFPEFFVKAFDDPAADLDKNGRVSLWEAFSYASAGVRQWYDQHGRLPTERPLLGDTGDGVGRDAQSPGADGAIARATYLEPDAAASAGGEGASGGLAKKKADLEAQIEALKARKPTIAPDQYDAELEKLLTELARVSRQIRAKT